MKKSIISLMVLTLLLGAFSLAQAAQQDFVLVNQTGYRIDVLNISSIDSNSWEGDILGSNYFENGQSYNIRFDPNERQCRWDMRVTDIDGDDWELRDFDACRTNRIVIIFRNGQFEFQQQ